MTEELEFYAAPGPMTSLDGYEQALAGLPTTPAEVATVVQGLVLHIFWAKAYDVDVSTERRTEVQIRSAARILGRALEIDPRPRSGRARRLTVLSATAGTFPSLPWPCCVTWACRAGHGADLPLISNRGNGLTTGW